MGIKNMNIKDAENVVRKQQPKYHQDTPESTRFGCFFMCCIVVAVLLVGALIVRQCDRGNKDSNYYQYEQSFID